MNPESKGLVSIGTILPEKTRSVETDGVPDLQINGANLYWNERHYSRRAMGVKATRAQENYISLERNKVTVLVENVFRRYLEIELGLPAVTVLEAGKYCNPCISVLQKKNGKPFVFQERFFSASSVYSVGVPLLKRQIDYVANLYSEAGVGVLYCMIDMNDIDRPLPAREELESSCKNTSKANFYSIPWRSLVNYGDQKRILTEAEVVSLETFFYGVVDGRLIASGNEGQQVLQQVSAKKSKNLEKKRIDNQGGGNTGVEHRNMAGAPVLGMDKKTVVSDLKMPIDNTKHPNRNEQSELGREVEHKKLPEGKLFFLEVERRAESISLSRESEFGETALRIREVAIQAVRDWLIQSSYLTNFGEISNGEENMSLDGVVSVGGLLAVLDVVCQFSRRFNPAEHYLRSNSSDDVPVLHVVVSKLEPIQGYVDIGYPVELTPEGLGAGDAVITLSLEDVLDYAHWRGFVSVGELAICKNAYQIGLPKVIKPRKGEGQGSEVDPIEQTDQLKKELGLQNEQLERGGRKFLYKKKIDASEYVHFVSDSAVLYKSSTGLRRDFRDLLYRKGDRVDDVLGFFCEDVMSRLFFDSHVNTGYSHISINGIDYEIDGSLDIRGTPWVVEVKSTILNNKIANRERKKIANRRSLFSSHGVGLLEIHVTPVVSAVDDHLLNVNHPIDVDFLLGSKGGEGARWDFSFSALCRYAYMVGMVDAVDLKEIELVIQKLFMTNGGKNRGMAGVLKKPMKVEKNVVSGDSLRLFDVLKSWFSRKK